MSSPRYAWNDIFVTKLEILLAFPSHQACQENIIFLTDLSFTHSQSHLLEGYVLDRRLPLNFLLVFRGLFARFKLVKQNIEIPLLEVTSIISCVKDIGSWVEVQCSHGESNLLHDVILMISNLLIYINVVDSGKHLTLVS